jgi:predicted acyltransferase
MLSELLDETITYIKVTTSHGLMSIRAWVFQTFFVPSAPPPLAALLYALAITALMYAAAYTMYRKKIFLRV